MRPPDDFMLTTDPAAVDLDVLHAALRESYWAPGIPRETVERSLAGSMPFTVLAPDGSMAGFARVITDRAVFAHIADVFVFEAHRGRGLSVRLMEAILGHPELQGLRRFQLHTADAHGLYARFGFASPATPAAYMVLERRPEDLYGR